MKNIDIVVPCYNESQVLNIFYNAVEEIILTMPNYQFNYIFVDDGSYDDTLYILKNLSKKDTKVKYISFSRNFGKEAAMYAGLKQSSGDMVLIMDSDMQNPPTMIPKMVSYIEQGYDCCGGYRSDRTGDGKLRTFFTNNFYKITNKISEVNMPNGAGDFRLMTRKMVNAILALSEVQRFSKGIFSWVGFNTKWISFENVERAGGVSKWNFFKLFSYAIDGLKTLILGIDVPGYASIITINLFIGGIIILSCGVLGEYIGKIYLEVKKRPIYIMAETNINKKDEK